MSELKRRLFKVVGDAGQSEGSRTEPIEEIREGIAQLLKQTRERYGQSLRDVSANLRIRMAYLQAIENGRFRELPGPTYAVGFVRSYAEYLGLDSAEIVRRFKGEVEGLDSRTHLAFPEPVPEGKVPGGAVIVISLLVLVIGYGGWYAITSRDADEPLIPKISDNLKALMGQDEQPASPAIGAATEPPAGAPAPEQSLAAAPTQSSPLPASTAQATATDPLPQSSIPAASSPQPTLANSGEGASAGLITAAPSALAPAAGTEATGAAAALEPGVEASADPAQQEVAVGSTEEDETAPSADGPAALEGALPAAPPIPEAPAVETAAAPAQPEPAAAGAQIEPVAGPAQVRLHARLASWIQISDATGRPVVTRTLAAGEVLDVPAEPGLTLFTGNAGGLEITVDGRPLPPLGAVGAVRRGIPLDPATLRQGQTVE